MVDASALASAAMERRKASGPPPYPPPQAGEEKEEKARAAPDGAASWLVRLSALRLPSWFGGELPWQRANDSDAHALRDRASLPVIRHPEVAAQRPSEDDG